MNRKIKWQFRFADWLGKTWFGDFCRLFLSIISKQTKEFFGAPLVF